MTSTPCEQCRRVHRGPRCKPDEARSVSVCVTLPRHVATELAETIPWGERSGFVAQAVEAALADAGGDG